ncbi:DUF3134 domain-containing protein [Capilliphycus salinus ALCB114379]|uniref:DUF3134 domain-containing protein n=1 Tax=Capilliphycus salinus TaxID=2768948 RepID=UPI0039A70F6E
MTNNNPSLRKIPVHEPADVIPSKQHISLLEWLQATGRLIPRDTTQESSEYLNDEEEISELIVDEGSYDDDDDDDMDDDSLED